MANIKAVIGLFAFLIIGVSVAPALANVVLGPQSWTFTFDSNSDWNQHTLENLTVSNGAISLTGSQLQGCAYSPTITGEAGTLSVGSANVSATIYDSTNSSATFMALSSETDFTGVNDFGDDSTLDTLMNGSNVLDLSGLADNYYARSNLCLSRDYYIDYTVDRFEDGNATDDYTDVNTDGGSYSLNTTGGNSFVTFTTDGDADFGALSFANDFPSRKNVPDGLTASVDMRKNDTIGNAVYSLRSNYSLSFPEPAASVQMNAGNFNFNCGTSSENTGMSYAPDTWYTATISFDLDAANDTTLTVEYADNDSVYFTAEKNCNASTTRIDAYAIGNLDTAGVNNASFDNVTINHDHIKSPEIGRYEVSGDRGGQVYTIISIVVILFMVGIVWYVAREFMDE